MIKKRGYLIILCVTVLLCTILFSACNENKIHDIERFYGEYCIPLDKYFEVTFRTDDENGLRDVKYNIIGVKQNSFVYAKRKSDLGAYEYLEMPYDENLLRELDRLMEFMGDHVVFNENGVYFVDSRENIDIAYEDFVSDESYGFYGQYNDFSCHVYDWDENFYSVKYKKNINVLRVDISSVKITDKNDTEWQIIISRKYKKY